jgi:hypothetical protein
VQLGSPGHRHGRRSHRSQTVMLQGGPPSKRAPPQVSSLLPFRASQPIVLHRLLRHLRRLQLLRRLQRVRRRHQNICLLLLLVPRLHRRWLHRCRWRRVHLCRWQFLRRRRRLRRRRLRRQRLRQGLVGHHMRQGHGTGAVRRSMRRLQRLRRLRL